MKTQGEEGHLYVKERGLEQRLPSLPSEGNNHANNNDLGHVASRVVRK